MESVAERVQAVRERIAAACARVGRDPLEVTLVAASKGRTPEEIAEARAAGIRDFGENYWQDARSKIEAAPAGVRWHFIGRLQANKAKYVARHFDVLQSLDSLTLAAALSKKLQDVDRTLQILVEVNIDNEQAKAGLEGEAALVLAEQAAVLPGLKVCGLMTMGAPGGDEAALRRRFRRMRGLFERLHTDHQRVLSMGMSADFEVAIEEGATMIRVGTAIFGPRPHDEWRNTHG